MTSRVFVLTFVLTIPQLAAGQESFGGKRRAVDWDGFKGFIVEPSNPGAEGERRWVWYAPTIGSHPNRSNDWVLRRLVSDGFYVVGVDVGESMGNLKGREAFSKFYDRVVREHKLHPKARLLAQSRGGLMLYNWAVENPEKVRCIAGIYPVCDLSSYPGLARAAKAYGLTTAEMERELAKHNPVDRIEPLAKARVPIMHIHGDSDKVVPLDKNSQPLIDRYRAFGGPAELIVVRGLGHAEVAAFFEDIRLVDFLKAGS